MDVIDLSALETPEENYRDYLARLCDRLGLDYAAYAGSNSLEHTIHGVVTYPDEWQRRYVAEGLQNIDPTLQAAARSIAPVDWSRLRGGEAFDVLFSKAGDHGIGWQGLTIPIRGPYGDVGMFSVTRDVNDTEWGRLKRRILPELQAAAVHLHDSIMTSGTLAKALNRPRLSARETEILQWTAAGKSQQDVADILGISHRTVEVHLRSAREKLGALSSAQAVGRAIGLGLIYPF
ncbi:LuxR family transcriptional regulator [Litorisediminicola beolgyonensis]|uniref:LuxR family transcriptional regulator n=1 Tax=Litorisediminicola beolgyonensis TaxID=1173614 RepID=A0ABW3ZEC5_9RHOB